MSIYFQLGLDSMDIRVEPRGAALTRGFMRKRDRYLWGLMAIQCDEEAVSIKRSACAVRHELTTLTGVMYVLLSMASVVVSGTVGLLVLSSSPMVRLKTSLVLYSSSILLMLVPSLIFEIRVRGLFESPNLWGFHDKHIHTTLAGMDSPRSIPKEATFFPSSAAVSQILIWIAVVSMMASFACFMIRVRRTRKHKGYLFSANLFSNRPSIFIGAPKPVVNPDLDKLIRPRKLRADSSGDSD